jgi:subtilisin family serine protease
MALGLGLLLSACGGAQDTATPTQVGEGERQRLIVQLHPAAITTEPEAGRARALQAGTLQQRTDTAIRAQSQRLLGAGGPQAGLHFSRIWPGFTVEVSGDEAEALQQRLEQDPAVLSVTPDTLASTGQVATERTLTEFGHWGLDRIDQRRLPLNQRLTTSTRGQGVTVFVLDSGISAHQQFGDRLAPGTDYIRDGHGSADCRGHGTHVAGTIGGSLAGVAPGVTLVSVRVLGCNGTGPISKVLAGIDWILDRPERPAVVNMSLGADAYPVLDEAVRSLLLAGFHVVVSAGNENTKACLRSPARVPGAITVGASDNADKRASFSNFGSCVDLLAPGQWVSAPDWRSPSAERMLSGTSMAAPHVAGTLALLLESRPTLTPTQLAQQLLAQSTPSVLAQLSGSPNRLLFAGSATALKFPPAHELHIGLLQGDTTVSRGRWTARATVRVLNASGKPMGGVKVSGLFQGATAPVSCNTATSGLCTLVSLPQGAGVAQLSIAVQALEGAAFTHRRERDQIRVLTIQRPGVLAPR